ncbi:hypothetical protein F5Y16DRAFT_386843 [Xylariaceae sp. FL0255]|nr:hypothetical protein F5Y16DRAFT_386843 [Xylariaceae sp. FL0255]
MMFLSALLLPLAVAAPSPASPTNTSQIGFACENVPDGTYCALNEDGLFSLMVQCKNKMELQLYDCANIDELCQYDVHDNPRCVNPYSWTSGN